MKKNFAAAKKVCILTMTLMSFFVWRQSTQNVYALEDKQTQTEAGTVGKAVSEEAVIRIETEDVKADEKRLMKVILLNADTVTQIPKYIVDKNSTYVLDESSIVVEETGRNSSEGADVITVSRKVESLSDNDLAGIEKTLLHDGIVCDLLSVIFEVEKENKYGIPTGYSAVCEYGGLKKYSVSHPSAWQMTAWYDICGSGEETDIFREYEEYEYIYVPAENRTEGSEETDGKEAEKTGEPESGTDAEVTFPEPEVRKIKIKPASEEDDKRNMIYILLLLAAGVAGAGGVLLFIIWFAAATAPIYVLKKGKRYRCIGRIRLKKEDGMYTACLTKRLLARAEIPVFMIKLPEKIRKSTRTGMLEIHCPEGKRILLTAGKEVVFTVEDEGV